jgi:hypothetical protein
MRRHLLSQFSTTTIAQILRDSSCPERMIPDSCLDTCGECAPSNHPVHIRLGEGIGRQLLTAASRTAKWITASSYNSHRKSRFRKWKADFIGVFCGQFALIHLKACLTKSVAYRAENRQNGTFDIDCTERPMSIDGERCVPREEAARMAVFQRRTAGEGTYGGSTTHWSQAHR